MALYLPEIMADTTFFLKLKMENTCKINPVKGNFYCLKIDIRLGSAGLSPNTKVPELLRF